jgi:WD40 repeat protein/tRNA A-37 threonylcarbamoyl transferase component Bud32
MNADLQPPTGQDWNSVLVECLEAQDSGQALDRQSYFARYPQYADQLREFFDRHDCLNQVAAPLRAAVAAVATIRQNTDTPRPGPRSAATSQAAGAPKPVATEAAFPSLEDYELLERIAGGGMGLIYKARQRSPNRLVALKMVRAADTDSAASLRRFRTEIELASSLEHPNIVPIYQVGQHNGQLFFTMRWMEGGDLARLLAEHPLHLADNRRAARLLATIARAVHFAHQHGILHRDLKPSNILLDAQGKPYVADFGLAKRLLPEDGPGPGTDRTKTGAILGTPSYVAPELTYGGREAATTAADVYGLGGILYFLLTGKPPFADLHPLETLRQVQETEPELPHRSNPKVDRNLETICLKCLRKEPGARYTSAETLAEDLECWLEGRPIKARRQGRWTRGRLWVRRNPALATTGVAAVVLAITLVAGALGIAWRDADAADRRAVAAEAEARRLRVEGYVADIRQAYTDWTTGDFAGIREVLTPYQDMPPEEDLRGFEWYWLMKQAQASSAAVPALRRSLQGHESDVYHVTFSPDGKQLATCGADTTARVWDIGSGRELLCLHGHQGDVNWISFSPDGGRLATAGDDGTVRLWDWATGQELDRVAAHLGEASGAEFAPDGKQLASTGSDGKLVLWDLTTRQRRTLWNQSGRVGIPCFSRDSSWLIAVGGGEDSVLNLWDSSRRATSRYAFPAGPHDSGGVALSPNGALVASTDGNLLRLHAVPSLQVLLEAPMPEQSGVDGPAFSPGGGMLACPGRDGRVYLFDTAFRNLLGQWQAHSGRTWSVAFAPNGHTLATTGNHGEIKLWKIAPLPLAEQLRNNLDYDAGHIEFSRDGRTFVLWGTVSGKRCFTVWDVEQGRVRATLPQSDGPRATALSPDGKTLVAVAANGKVYNYDTVGGVSHNLQGLGKSSPQAGALALSPDGALLAQALRNQGFTLRSLRLERPLQQLEPAARYSVASFLEDSKTLLAGDLAGRVRAWNLATGELCHEWAAHPAELLHLQLSADGKTLATADPKVIRLWNGLGGECRHVLRGHRPYIMDLAFAPDGRTLVSSGRDGTLRFWHVATGRELFHLTLIGAEIDNLAFTPDGSQLAAIVQLNGARVYTVDAAARR